VKPIEKEQGTWNDPSTNVKIHNIVAMKQINDNVMMLKEATRMVQRNVHVAVEKNKNERK